MEPTFSLHEASKHVTLRAEIRRKASRWLSVILVFGLPHSRLGPGYRQEGNRKSFPEGIIMALHQ